MHIWNRWMQGLLIGLIVAAPTTGAAGEPSTAERTPAEREDEASGDGANASTDGESDEDDGDTRGRGFNADAVYERPVVARGSSTAVGGYVESNLNHALVDGIPEGPSFELRRFNVFFQSAIGSRLRFVSELEFEHGTEEILLETAQVDYKIDTALQARFGILLPPIGAFNQNHDGPNWEFNDRPLVATEILPATLSEPGAGVHGKFLFGDLGLDYQLYATNGLGPGIASNETGRTSIPAGKREGVFEDDNNPVPAVSGRVALRHFEVGEVGVSAYWSRYNDFAVEGDRTDRPRAVTMMALDYRAALGDLFEARGEAGYAIVDPPADVGPEIGDRQIGAHIDLIGHVWRPTLFDRTEAELNLNLRGEYVDFNVGEFETTGEPIGDEIYALVPGVSFRPVSEAVVRMNYRREWRVDLRKNPPAHAGIFQFGVATYF